MVLMAASLWYEAPRQWTLTHIEHVNRRLKIFKILCLPYRNRRGFSLRCNLIAAIYNFEVSLPVSKTFSAQS